MKKNLKKSKFVILPALATLVLTSVATVTGTAAWFTVNRTVTVSGNKFETKILDGNLKVAITKGVGITDDVTENSTATASVDGYLTHGSYNAVAGSAGSLFVANLNDAGQTESYSDKGNVATAVTAENEQVTHSNWFAGTTGAENDKKNIWYGVSWKMKFTTANQNNDTIALLFDPTGSKAIDANGKGETIKGLRIAFMTTTELIVASGDKAAKVGETPSVSLKHVVSSTESTKTANFDSDIFFKIGDKNAIVPLAKDYDSNIKTRPTYLGDVGANGLEVTVVAWFEGEDPSIVDNKELSSVTTDLNFYARRYTKA